MIDEKEILHIIKDIEDLQEAVNYVMDFEDDKKKEFVKYIKNRPALMQYINLMQSVIDLFYSTNIFGDEDIKALAMIIFEEAKKKMADSGYIDLDKKNILDVLKKNNRYG